MVNIFHRDSKYFKGEFFKESSRSRRIIWRSSGQGYIEFCATISLVSIVLISFLKIYKSLDSIHISNLKVINTKWKKLENKYGKIQTKEIIKSIINKD